MTENQGMQLNLNQLVRATFDLTRNNLIVAQFTG